MKSTGTLSVALTDLASGNFLEPSCGTTDATHTYQDTAKGIIYSGSGASQAKVGSIGDMVDALATSQSGTVFAANPSTTAGGLLYVYRCGSAAPAIKVTGLPGNMAVSGGEIQGSTGLLWLIAPVAVDSSGTQWGLYRVPLGQESVDFSGGPWLKIGRAHV